VAPFVRSDNATGLKPLESRRKFPLEIGPRRCPALDLPGPARPLDEPLAERVHRAKIGPHSFEHDLSSDIDHVTVADAVLVHHVAHLHARPQFPALRLRAKNTDL